MITFEHIILHNFGSYSHTEFDLQNRGFCLVTGRNNFAKDNATSNGSGKSFLWNAICFALTGETLNGLRTNLKNINVADDNSCYVTLIFSENTDRYCLTRHVAPRTDLKIIKNDVDVSGKGIRESEKKLVELLPDISKNLVASTILIGQGMPNKFSSFSPSGRKDLLEKLTKADFMIEDVKQRVSNRLSELTAKLRTLEEMKVAKRSQRDVYQLSLSQKQAELQKMVRPDFQQQILAQQELLSNLDATINSYWEESQQIELQMSEVSKVLFDKTSEKTTALEKLKHEADQSAYTLVEQQAQYTAEHKALSKQLAQYEAVTDTCPTCGQKIPGAHKPDTSNIKKQLADLAQALAQISESLALHRKAYNEQFTSISAYYDSQVAETQNVINNLRAQSSTVSKNLRVSEQTKTTITQKLYKLQQDCDSWDARKQALTSEIEQLESLIKQLDTIILQTEAEWQTWDEHLKVVRKMESLIKRDFRGFLLSNIIDYLNMKAKDFCEIVFGTRDLEVYLEGNDLNISYCSKMFDNLSGGEKQKVDLILQFAIRNMLMLYLNFNSNILVLDEITDFLDKKSCAAILNLITRELNTIESVFIISHHASALALPIDSELVIEKNENGISDIIIGA